MTEVSLDLRGFRWFDAVGVPAATPKPREVLTRAKAALAAAGTIKANIILDVHYPHRYTSSQLQSALENLFPKNERHN